MGDKYDMDAIEKEVRELILNSKSRRSTTYEPCNGSNIPECLESIHEELTLCGIRFTFNPSVDYTKDEDTTISIVRLINATWNLLMLHKEVSTNAEKLKERNYSLQQNNFYLNSLIERLKTELNEAKSNLKQSEEAKRQMAVKLDDTKKELFKSAEDLKRCKKQTASKEDQLSKQYKKLEKEHLMLQDKSRRTCGTFVSRTESNNMYIEEYKLREKNYKETIAKLQDANRKLLLEVISLKEEILKDESD